MYGKELRRSLRLHAAQILVNWLPKAPEPVGRELCAGIGRLAHGVVRRDRELTRGNLRRVHPEWEEALVRAESKRVFAELGRNIYDFLRYPGLAEPARDALVTFNNESFLRDPLEKREGAILVTGHWGCWELLAAALARRGYPFKAVARPLREPRLNRALTTHRTRMGFQTVSDESPREALRHLRGGGFLGVLMDQRLRQGGVTVEFLGQRTRMTDAPARLSMKTGAPLIPFGIHRASGNRHRVEVLPAVRPRPGASARDTTQELAHALSRLIALAPEQWMWLHPRWEDA